MLTETINSPEIPVPSKIDIIKVFIKKRQKILIIALVFFLLSSGTAIALFQINKSPSVSPSPYPLPTPFFSPSPSPLPSLSPIPSPAAIKKSPSPSPALPSPSPVHSPLPSPLPSPSPSPSPARTPNPPQINISYPAENQTITMNQDQTFCVVDVPVGGDTSGIQRKHKINNQDWTSYASMATLCYSPQEGANTISLQFKNSFGDESIIYSRNFIFHQN